MSDISERLKWWIEARFGMFIHWGLYALPARGTCVLLWERIPKSKYRVLANKFKPNKFNAEKWVELAQEAGMRYMYLTTKHNDGFCLWDSKASDFTSVKTSAKRDFVGEYVDACRNAGIRVGLYYAIDDSWWWEHWYDGQEENPEGWKKFTDYIHNQVTELMTNYGKIDVLWYDGVPVSKHGKAWTSEKLYTIPRTLQPDIIINDRVYSFGHKGDFTCSECSIGGSDRPWESCYTIDDACWGYHPGDPHLKSPMDLVRLLVSCVAGNGNFTLNVGPKADGVIPETQARRVRAVGKWLKYNGESIYGAGSPLTSPYVPGRITAKDNTLYIHVLYWPGKELCLAGIINKVLKARIVATSEELPFEQNNDRLFIRNLPKRPIDPIDTVIAIEFEDKMKAEVDEWWKLERWWLRQ